MATPFVSDPAFHEQAMGLLGPGFWRDLIAALVAATAYALAQGALPPASAATILVLAAGIGWGARRLEPVQLQPA